MPPYLDKDYIKTKFKINHNDFDQEIEDIIEQVSGYCLRETGLKLPQQCDDVDDVGTQIQTFSTTDELKPEGEEIQEKVVFQNIYHMKHKQYRVNSMYVFGDVKLFEGTTYAIVNEEFILMTLFYNVDIDLDITYWVKPEEKPEGNPEGNHEGPPIAEKPAANGIASEELNFAAISHACYLFEKRNNHNKSFVPKEIIKHYHKHKIRKL